MLKRVGIHTAGIIGIPTLGAAGAALGGLTPHEQFLDYLINTKGSSEVWALVDMIDPTIIAQVNTARNGTATGFAVQNNTGPVTGTLAPLLDGANDYGDIQTASLTALWDGDLGSIGILAKASGVGVWTDGARRDMFAFTVDANNRIRAIKSDVNDTIQFQRLAGGGLRQCTFNPGSPTGWFLLGGTWDRVADEVKAYYGTVASGTVAQVGGTQNGLAAFAGALTSSLIGARSAAPLEVHDGWEAYLFLKMSSAVWDLTDYQDIMDAIS